MQPDPTPNTDRILIVDDDDMLRTIMRAELEEDGYTVIEAADGKEAADVCAEICPDLLIVDVVMPRMNGFELCQALRSRPATAFVPILMATGLDDRLRCGRHRFHRQAARLGHLDPPGPIHASGQPSVHRAPREPGAPVVRDRSGRNRQSLQNRFPREYEPRIADAIERDHRFLGYHSRRGLWADLE